MINDWLEGDQDYFDEVPRHGYIPMPGDIWIQPARGGGTNRVPGHIIIVGDDGNAYDASLGDHGPERRGNNNVPPGMRIWRPNW